MVWDSKDAVPCHLLFEYIEGIVRRLIPHVRFESYWTTRRKVIMLFTPGGGNHVFMRFLCSKVSCKWQDVTS